MSNREARKRIMEVAGELFYRQGYSKTGINQIIKEANVAKASLYYHFATKEELCIAYLKDRHERWMNKFNAFLENKSHKTLAEFDFLMIDNTENNFRGCSFINLLAEIEDGNSEILEILQNHKRTLGNHFEKQYSKGNNDKAFSIYCLFENAIIESQLFKSNEPVNRIKSIAESILAKF